mmetsp:Transcript_24743/g.57124  ORF Transcript_24743/g.57124 Transcript_24743/m.57124 type:complete len:242 (-) Transcript_24743:367-1092(-)
MQAQDYAASALTSSSIKRTSCVRWALAASYVFRIACRHRTCSPPSIPRCRGISRKRISTSTCTSLVYRRQPPAPESLASSVSNSASSETADDSPAFTSCTSTSPRIGPEGCLTASFAITCLGRTCNATSTTRSTESGSDCSRPRVSLAISAAEGRPRYSQPPGVAIAAASTSAKSINAAHFILGSLLWLARLQRKLASDLSADATAEALGVSAVWLGVVCVAHVPLRMKGRGSTTGAVVIL